MTSLVLARIDSPIGEMHAVFGADGLVDLDFAEIWEAKQRRLGRRFGALRIETGAGDMKVREALARYFDGQLDAIDALRTNPGGTAFQQAVWRALRQIPAGTTVSYGEFAQRLGRPRAARAVGAANGQNPIAVVIPCHRLIGSDGQLVKYASGLERKRWLLQHEGAAAAGTAAPAHTGA